MTGFSSLGASALGSEDTLTIAYSLNVPQASLTSVALATPPIRAYQASVVVAYNIPAEYIRSTQAALTVAYKANNRILAIQATVFAVVRGVIDNPKLRSWSFTLDGHDFFVLKLGTSRKTLVFDLSTGQWSWWSSSNFPRWRTTVGINWKSSGTVPTNYGSNVLVGDDSYGHLWILNPEYGLDDGAVDDNPLTFPRIATGQMTVRARNFIPIYSVTLTGSLGSPALTTNTITLSYSDDQGNTYISASEPIAVEANNYAQEMDWQSLGLVRAPGRLFKISDDGSLARIDSLDVNE